MKPLFASAWHAFQSAESAQTPSAHPTSTRPGMEPVAIIFACSILAVSSLFIYLLLRP